MVDRSGGNTATNIHNGAITNSSAPPHPRSRSQLIGHLSRVSPIMPRLRGRKCRCCGTIPAFHSSGPSFENNRGRKGRECQRPAAGRFVRPVPQRDPQGRYAGVPDRKLVPKQRQSLAVLFIGAESAPPATSKRANLNTIHLEVFRVRVPFAQNPRFRVAGRERQMVNYEARS